MDNCHEFMGVNSNHEFMYDFMIMNSYTILNVVHSITREFRYEVTH